MYNLSLVVKWIIACFVLTFRSSLDFDVCKKKLETLVLILLRLYREGKIDHYKLAHCLPRDPHFFGFHELSQTVFFV